MKKVHIIWAHPRSDSLTAQVVDAVKEECRLNGFEASELDLYRSGFSPVLPVEDEPDWDNPQKAYSPEVMALADSLKDKDVLIFVFPVWWYSFPAILKGYIDRVFNHGIFYGDGKKLPASTVRWIALVGDVQDSFERRGNDQNMKHVLNSCIASYCGVADSQVAFLYDTMGQHAEKNGVEKHYQALIEEAKAVVRKLK